MAIMDSRPISIGIACPFDRANAFLSDPANWPAWAAGLGQSLTRSPDGTWTAQTPEGPATVRFTPPNAFGVLDHVVILATGAEVHVPLRVIPNGDGCEVTLNLFRQPGMTHEAFESDAGLVRRDLERLKVLLEA
jgi:hypothetical protein